MKLAIKPLHYPKLHIPAYSPAEDGMKNQILCVFVRAWLVLTVLLIATTAHAEDELLAKLPKVKNPEAHAHIVAGNARYRTKEFEKALDEYKKGLQLEDAAIFLYNIGQCDRFLHRWDDAIWVFRRFLDRAKPEPALVERVEGFIQDAEQQQAADKARTPPRDPGDAASPGESRSPRASAAPPAPQAGPGKPATRFVPGEPWYRDPAGWTETGVGVIGIGAGALLLASVVHLNDEAHKTMNVNARISLYDRATTRRTEAAIIGGVGVVAIVIGIATLIRHPQAHEEPVRSSWQIGITGSGVAVAGQF